MAKIGIRMRCGSKFWDGLGPEMIESVKVLSASFQVMLISVCMAWSGWIGGSLSCQN